MVQNLSMSDTSQFNDSFQFLLGENGIQIIDGAGNRIGNEGPGVIIPGSSQRAIVGDETFEALQKTPNSDLWLLVPSTETDSRTDVPFFHIQMVYGEKSPRMTLKGQGKNAYVLVTTVDKDGYKNAQKSVWKIFKA